MNLIKILFYKNNFTKIITFLFILSIFSSFIYTAEDINFSLEYKKKFDNIIGLVKKGVRYKNNSKFDESSEYFNMVIIEIDNIIADIQNESDNTNKSSLNLNIANNIKFIDIEKESVNRLLLAKNLYVVGLYQESYDSLYIVSQLLKKVLAWYFSIDEKAVGYAQGVVYQAKNILTISNNFKLKIDQPHSRWISGHEMLFKGSVSDNFGEITGFYMGTTKSNIKIICKSTNFAFKVILPENETNIDIFTVISNDFHMVQSNKISYFIDDSPPLLHISYMLHSFSNGYFVLFNGLSLDNESDILSITYQINNGQINQLTFQTNWQLALPIFDFTNKSFNVNFILKNHAGYSTSTNILIDILQKPLSFVSYVTNNKHGSILLTNCITNIIEITNMIYLTNKINNNTIFTNSKEFFISTIYFKKNSSFLEENMKEKLNYIAKILNITPYKKIILSGHSDISGEKKINVLISYQRTKSVKNFLLPLLDNKKQFKLIPLDYSLPASEKPTKQGFALNRRVEINIIY